MPLPFENFLLDTLNSEQKSSVKKTGRPAGQPAMILKFTSRVEKILTGSISVFRSVYAYRRKERLCGRAIFIRCKILIF